MRIWALEDPEDQRFAWFRATSEGEPVDKTHDGSRSWTDIADRHGLCRKCGAARPYQVKPGLTIEWGPGSDVLGSFSWSEAHDSALVMDAVARELRAVFSGLQLGPVTMVAHERVNRPRKSGRRVRRRLRLPWVGPPLYELLMVKSIPVDLERSSIRLERQCGLCGCRRWKLEGHEYIEHMVEQVRRAGELCGYKFHTVRHRRIPGKGLFVRCGDLEGADFFTTHEVGGMFCTDRVKEFIEQRGYTNVAFREYGDLI